VSLTKGSVVTEDLVKSDAALIISGETGCDPSANEDAQNAFRNALGQFCTGVTAITTVTPDGELVGITVNSFNSLSLKPPLILWSIANTTPSFDCFKSDDPFVVNVLASDQKDLAMQFAKPGSDTKFDGVTTHVGLHGVPIIDGCVAYLECEVQARHPGGDHDIIIGRVCRFFNLRKAPLLFYAGVFQTLTPA
jgi:flavin reductase (DIM6/NTAB) family NADH-FMN oxidoreductase RutF